jgi:lysozyme family protein
MASFEIAYRKYILPAEGGYANVVGDKGGETYAGIARNYHPNWPGWTYIDNIKRTPDYQPDRWYFDPKRNGWFIKNNTKFPDVQYQADDFYLDWWNSQRFGEIKSQDVANLLFDYNVNSSSIAIKAIQRIVNVPVDGGMGPKTITAINASDPVKVYTALKAERKAFYDSIVKRDPTQQTFYAGWMNRIASFPDLITPTSIGVVTIGLGLALLIFFLTQKPKILSQG